MVSKNKGHANVVKYMMCATQYVICWLSTSIIRTGMTGRHKRVNNEPLFWETIFYHHIYVDTRRLFPFFNHLT